MIDRIWQLIYIVAYRLAKVYWFIRRPTTRGAYVAVWVDDSVLIVRNSYKRQFAMPAGGVEKHETYLEAAVRELREEVGIQANESELQLYRTFQGRGEFKTDSAQLFELLLSHRPSVRIDNREVVLAEFVTINEALSRPLVPVVHDYLNEKSTPGRSRQVSVLPASEAVLGEV